MVEWKKLGEVCTILRGNRVTKGELVDNGKFPVISGGVTPMGFIDSYNREPNTITVSQYGTAGYVDFQYSRFWANDICYCVYPEKSVDNKYLWYVLKSKQDLLYAIRNTDATPYSLPVDTLKSILIPIPSLEEQTRIVGILDTFTSAIDNLKEQIAQRRKQYEYYREQLLDLEGKPGVAWKKLGEITTRNKGISITAGQMGELASTNGNVRVFAAGSTIADIDEFKLPPNCAHKLPSIIVKSRGYIDFEFYEKPFTHKNEMWSYSFENKNKGKFIYYYLSTQTKFFQIKAKSNSVKLPQLCVADTDNYLIPLPSLHEQQRIVSILDTFEASIQNLEAQLKQREKQYEYYRNKLLTFE